MLLIFWDDYTDGTLKPILSPMYGSLGRSISISGSDNWCLLNVLIMDGIDISSFVIMSMSISMSQPSTSMAPLWGDDDTINDVSMVGP
jgi:hypothetical protein